MKNLLLLLLVLCSCTKSTIEPTITAQDLVSKYNLKEVVNDGTAFSVTVSEAQRLLNYQPKEISGARLGYEDTRYYLKVSTLYPNEPSINTLSIRVNVDYVYCSERNQLLGARVYSALASTTLKGYSYYQDTTSIYCNVSDYKIDYGNTGYINYKFTMNNKTYTSQYTFNFGNVLYNTVIKSKPDGVACKPTFNPG